MALKALFTGPVEECLTVKLGERTIEEAIDILEFMDPVERIRWTSEQVQCSLVATTSGGKTSRILPHLIQKALPETKVPVVFVDTGHYLDETYKHVSCMVKDGVDVRVYGAEMSPTLMESLYGRLWEESGPAFEDFLKIVKHEPLNRAFRDIGAMVWVRALMRYQTPERANMPVLEYKNGMFRLYPVIDWTKEQAMTYLKEHNLPMNVTHFDITKGASGQAECKIGDACGYKDGGGI